MPTANEIRKRFLSFFEARGHRLVPSAPVVPHGDPTLLFTNAGMNQFKDVFLGTGARDYTRAADTQKCIRVSGKHNDLDEVGADTYHHTFFEMLGNWSFGDYFKEDAIRWAWEFLVDEMGLDRDKLWATVFGGDEALALPPDEEAERLWPEVTDIPRARVLRFGRKENFWEMAETGPCGPCSEIHLDLGPGACDRSATPGHRCSVNGDCARFIEIWNLVFIQYQHMEDGSLRPLPARHVDTGMGFERLVSVVQGKTSNYDTDLFAPLLGRISELAGAPYGEDGRKDMAMRVVADHARTLSVAIADNVVPSNKDRGYVLRRILRRASRYGYQVLGLTEPFIHQVVPVVAEIFSEVFPEIAKRRDHIARVVEAEERAFLRTLERGVLLFEKAAGELAAAGAAVLDGAVAFRLYETYGFPRDLTELMCRERGFTLDEAGWARAEAAHVEASKGASGQRLDPGELEGLPPTRFVGYWELGLAGTLGHEAETRLLRLVDNEYLVLYESPFYAESGGQVGDTGLVVAPGFRFVVRDTQRVGDLIVHHGDLEEADLAALPERVTARVDLERRRRIMANHTATHLLHAALKTVVSKEANQKGSLVHPDYLRFDFTHDAALTGAELEAIERMVNQRIAENHPLSIGEDEYQEAISKGVTALFGEKYGDRVRVVRVPEVSAELCGGTHCRATGDIGLFQILSERAISAGVRRIVAETRDAALGRVQEGRRLLQETARLLGVPPEQLPARVEKLALDLRELKKGAKKAAQTDLGALRKALLGEAPVEGGVRLVFRHLPELDGDQAAQLADAFRSGEEPVAGVLVAGAAGDRPPALVAFATKDLGKRVNATELVRAVGKGGGRPDFAKGAAAAGDPAALEAALARACDDLRAKLR